VIERVLDASVLLAVARSETYDAGLLSILEGSVLGAVNYAEVLSRLLDLRISVTSPAVRLVFDLLDRIEPFTVSQAHLASDLRLITSHAGLSLGDRACLALALELGAEVYTADQQWSRITVGCPIHLIR
jgi:ribonuclease VapC